MTMRGLHLAIDDAAARRLLAADGDEAVASLLEEFEETAAEAHSFASDKAWDAIHRSMVGGSWDEEGQPPLSLVVGGRLLTRTTAFVALIEPQQVAEVAVALASADEQWLRARYFANEFPGYRQGQSEADFDYTWSCFDGLPEFFRRAAAERRWVVFST